MLKLKNITKPIILYLFVLIHGIIVGYPIFLMVITSFKNNKDIFINPFGLPQSFDLSNFKKILELSNYELYFRNSIFVTMSSIILILLVSSFASYAIAKFKFPAKKFIYLYFIIGLMIPIKLGTINIIQIMVKLHIYDNLLSLILIYTTMGIPIGVFILTDFIKLIPEELSNAARIDGSSEFGIFFKIIIPLLKPALATVAIFNALPIWNDFWFPLVLISSDNLKTVPLASALLIGQYETQWGLVFTVLSLASVPMILLYLLLSKQFVKGLAAGAFKG